MSARLAPRACDLAVAILFVFGCHEEANPLASRDDDFSGVDAEPWLVLHPELADASLEDGQLRLRPEPFTAWGGSGAYHRYVLMDGDFAITSHVEVGDLLGGPALPGWRLGGLLIRVQEPGPVDAYHAAFGTVSATMSPDMVAAFMSTAQGHSVLDFLPHPSGSGEIRICRVGTTVRAVHRPDGEAAWTLLDERERPDLPDALAAGPMAYAYAPVGDFEAAFDYVDFDPLTTMDECEGELAEPGGSSEGSSEGQGSSAADDDVTSGETTGDGDTAAPPTDVPLPTAPCPPLTDGIVTLCPAALGGACRDMNVSNTAGATGSGPLQLHLHGTYETPDGVLAWDSAALSILDMAIAEGGVLVLPYADPDAVARSAPFPWWAVGDPDDPQMQTDREDDFVFFDEIVACFIEAGLASPDRINVSGMSAGGIMTSHLVERRGYFASAVSWSGGLPVQYQPALPAGPVAVMVIHGGPTDVYCGPGVPGGGCYDFVAPSEAFAADVLAAGNWAFLCDHQAGHSTAMGEQGAEFMELATFDAHPWKDYPFGSGGHWMLDNYCYAAGDPSPWE